VSLFEGTIQKRVCRVRLRVSTPEGWDKGAPSNDSLGGGPPLEHLDIDAVVDTGAMVSAIPVSVLERLGCPSFGAVSFQSVLGPHDQGDQVAGTYAARLELSGLLEVKWVQVLGVHLDTALVGMDLLEHLSLEVDGPGGVFRLTRRTQ
jgi:predicted aspartyl protease